MVESAEPAGQWDQTASLKVPPHSIEAEQAVLGALMLDNSTWEKVADRLAAEDFYRRDHQIIYRTLGELAEANEPGDAVTVSERLEQTGELDDVGGLAYLAALAKDTPSAANVVAYADIVRERSVLRQLIRIGHELAETGFVPEGRTSKELIEHAEQEIFRIAEQGLRRTRGYSPIKDLLKGAVDRIDEMLHSDSHITGVPTGIDKFDEKTAGLQPGDLVIVAARPSMGKCLAHDSEIVLEDGSVRTIEQVYRERRGRLATLGDDYRLDWTEPCDFVDDGQKPVFEVETRLGRRVETTSSHPFLTLEGWKPLSELDEGDYVAVPRRLPAYGERALRDCEVRLLAYFIGDGGLTTATPKFTAGNPEIQADFAEAVEAFGGVHLQAAPESWRTPSWSVVTDHGSLAVARETFAREVDQAIQVSGRTARDVAAAVGVAPATVSYWRRGRNVPDPATRMRLAEVLETFPASGEGESELAARRNRPNPLRQWLASHGLAGRGAHDKAIPDCVYTLPREQLALFLNRLFATDGWVSRLASGQSQIGYSTVSQCLARQVQHLLLRFGIIAKLRERWVRYGDTRRPAWQLDITHAESIRCFIEEIGVHGKGEALESVARAVRARRQQSNTDLVPVDVWKLIDRERGDLSWAELARRAGVADSNVHAYRRAVSRQHLRKFALALQSRTLMDLADSDVYWDRIESITALGEKQVYDLTIPDTHNFIANDVCVHNTSLAMNFAEHAAIQEKKPAAIFSMEMSGEQLAMRMISSLGRVDQARVRNGSIAEEDWPRITSAVQLMSDAPLFIDDTPALTPSELRARCRRLKREHGLGLVVIDYLQLMQVAGTIENRATEISEISRGLKALAKELDVPVVALSQLNRNLEQRPDKRPKMADLRESGSIEQDADVIVFIYRDEVYNPETNDKGIAELIIEKQRNGPTGKVMSTFLDSYTRFENFISDDYGDEEPY